MSGSVQQWLSALQAAFQNELTKHTGSTHLPPVHLWTSVCAMHCGCVWVVFGAQVEHVQWRQTEPAQLANDLMSKIVAHAQGRGNRYAPPRP